MVPALMDLTVQSVSIWNLTELSLLVKPLSGQSYYNHAVVLSLFIIVLVHVFFFFSPQNWQIAWLVATFHSSMVEL